MFRPNATVASKRQQSGAAIGVGSAVSSHALPSAPVPAASIPAPLVPSPAKPLASAPLRRSTRKRTSRVSSQIDDSPAKSSASIVLAPASSHAEDLEGDEIQGQEEEEEQPFSRSGLGVDDSFAKTPALATRSKKIDEATSPASVLKLSDLPVPPSASASSERVLRSASKLKPPSSQKQQRRRRNSTIATRDEEGEKEETHERTEAADASSEERGEETQAEKKDSAAAAASVSSSSSSSSSPSAPSKPEIPQTRSRKRRQSAATQFPTPAVLSGAAPPAPEWYDHLSIHASDSCVNHVHSALVSLVFVAVWLLNPLPPSLLLRRLFPLHLRPLYRRVAAMRHLPLPLLPLLP